MKACIFLAQIVWAGGDYTKQSLQWSIGQMATVAWTVGVVEGLGNSNICSQCFSQGHTYYDKTGLG